ncbi:hypothetical protein [Clostridium sp. CF012]|uniref:hypothetical protein n=1 Tax=Clostridium sp. CF012 TaxID=2843319 RepID=UPI001C0B7BD6|nr:hypothetical protein [Clostridium sp. CF012]MBU3144602.1 hypothetical protein [Clostridium sp. CF012]
MFEGQLQKYYYDLHDVDYQYKSIDCVNDNYVLSDYKGKEEQDRNGIKLLINIYEGNLNKIGDEKYTLSSTWLKDKNNLQQ